MTEPEKNNTERFIDVLVAVKEEAKYAKSAGNKVTSSPEVLLLIVEVTRHAVEEGYLKHDWLDGYFTASHVLDHS